MIPVGTISLLCAAACTFGASAARQAAAQSARAAAILGRARLIATARRRIRVERIRRGLIHGKCLSAKEELHAAEHYVDNGKWETIIGCTPRRVPPTRPEFKVKVKVKVIEPEPRTWWTALSAAHDMLPPLVSGLMATTGPGICSRAAAHAQIPKAMGRQQRTFSSASGSSQAPPGEPKFRISDVTRCADGGAPIGGSLASKVSRAQLAVTQLNAIAQVAVGLGMVMDSTDSASQATPSAELHETFGRVSKAADTIAPTEDLNFTALWEASSGEQSAIGGLDPAVEAGLTEALCKLRDAGVLRFCRKGIIRKLLHPDSRPNAITVRDDLEAKAKAQRIREEEEAKAQRIREQDEAKAQRIREQEKAREEDDLLVPFAALVESLDDVLSVSFSWGRSGRPPSLPVIGNVKPDSRAAWIDTDGFSRQPGRDRLLNEDMARLMEDFQPSKANCLWDHVGSAGNSGAPQDDESADALDDGGRNSRISGDPKEGMLLDQQLWFGDSTTQRQALATGVFNRVVDCAECADFLLTPTVNGAILAGLPGSGKSTLVTATGAIATATVDDMPSDLLFVHMARPFKPLPQGDGYWHHRVSRGSDALARIIDRSLQLCGLRDDIAASTEASMRAAKARPVQPSWPRLKHTSQMLHDASRRLAAARRACASTQTEADAVSAKPIKVFFVLDEGDMFFSEPDIIPGLMDNLLQISDSGTPIRFLITGSAAYLRYLFMARADPDVMETVYDSIRTSRGSDTVAAMREALPLTKTLDYQRVVRLSTLPSLSVAQMVEFGNMRFGKEAMAAFEDHNSVLDLTCTRDVVKAVIQGGGWENPAWGRLQTALKNDPALVKFCIGLVALGRERLTSPFVTPLTFDEVARAASGFGPKLGDSTDLVLEMKANAVLWEDKGFILNKSEEGTFLVMDRRLSVAGALQISEENFALSASDLAVLQDPSEVNAGEVTERLMAEGIAEFGIAAAVRLAVSSVGAPDEVLELLPLDEPETVPVVMSVSKMSALGAPRVGIAPISIWKHGSTVAKDVKKITETYEQGRVLSDPSDGSPLTEEEAKLDAALSDTFSFGEIHCKFVSESPDIKGGDVLVSFDVFIRGVFWRYIVRFQDETKNIDALVDCKGSLSDGMGVAFKLLSSSVASEGMAVARRAFKYRSPSHPNAEPDQVMIVSVLSSAAPVAKSLSMEKIFSLSEEHLGRLDPVESDFVKQHGHMKECHVSVDGQEKKVTSVFGVISGKDKEDCASERQQKLVASLRAVVYPDGNMPEWGQPNRRR